MLFRSTGIRAGMKDSTLALMVRGDGTLALQGTGSADLSLGDGFASASATEVGVAFNNTGEDVSRTVTVTVGATSVSAPLEVKNGEAAVVAKGLKAEVVGFVTLSGDFGIQKSLGVSSAGDALLVVTDKGSAGLTLEIGRAHV